MNELKNLLTSFQDGAQPWDPSSQFKGDGVLKIKFSGNKPSNLWGRLVAGFKRLRYTKIKEDNRSGIVAYWNALLSANETMHTVARQVFRDRWNAGRPLTLRAVREMAVEEFCTEDFINTHIIPAQAELDVCQDDDEAKDRLWTKATEALELLKAHLGNSAHPKDVSRSQRERDAMDLVEAKLQQIQQRVITAPKACTTILISSKYFKQYLEQKKVFQGKYEDMTQATPEKWEQYKLDMGSLHAIAVEANNRYGVMLGALEDEATIIQHNIKRILQERKNILRIEQLSDKDDEFTDPDLQQIKNFSQLAKQFGIQEALKDGVWDTESLKAHNEFMHQCHDNPDFIRYSYSQRIAVPKTCAEIVISNNYLKKYLEEKKVFQGKYEDMTEADPERWGQYKLDMDSLHAIAIAANNHCGLMLGALGDEATIIQHNIKRILQERKNILQIEQLSDKDDEFTDPDLQQIKNFSRLAKQFDIQGTLKDGVWDTESLKAHNEFMKQCHVAFNARNTPNIA